MSLLILENLRKEYVRDCGVFAAVDDAILSVGVGDLLGIVGRSGSGKSTLLNMVAGLLTPTSGRVVFDGQDLCAMPDARRSALRNDRIGVVPQGHSLLNNYTVIDNIRLPHFFACRDGDGSGRAHHLMDELGIAHLAGMRPARLSGGEMRRVAIARALMNRPVLVLADEPTGDLDEENSRLVMDIFANLAEQGTAVIYSTHEREAAERAHRVFSMREGRLGEVTGRVGLGAMATGLAG